MCVKCVFVHHYIYKKADEFKLMTRKWNIFNVQSNANYDVEIDVTYNAVVLKFNICDCDDAHILVRGDITIVGSNLFKSI